MFLARGCGHCGGALRWESEDSAWLCCNCGRWVGAQPLTPDKLSELVEQDASTGSNAGKHKGASLRFGERAPRPEKKKALEMLKMGCSVVEVAEATGYAPRYIRGMREMLQSDGDGDGW